MNYNKLVIIFASVILTTMHLDSALRKVGRVVSRCITLPKGASVRVLHPASREHKHEESWSSFGLGKRLIGPGVGMVAMCLPTDWEDENECLDVLAGVGKIENKEEQALNYIHALSDSTRLWTQGTIDFMISYIKGVMRADSGGIFTYTVYMRINWLILNGYLVDPEFLFMLLTREDKFSKDFLLLQSAIEERYKFLVREAEKFKTRQEDDGYKELYRRGQMFYKWVGDLINVFHKANPEFFISVPLLTLYCELQRSKEKLYFLFQRPQKRKS
jgi:hypothetical protein